MRRKSRREFRENPMRAALTHIENLDPRRFRGRVAAVNGLVVEATGPRDALALGGRARIKGRDGDDHNEPVADAVRGILDGHVVMTREIAERGRMPAIDVLKSVSLTMPDCCAPGEPEVIRAAKGALSAYADMEELIRLGAYAKGSNPEVDEAIRLNSPLEALLGQDKNEVSTTEESFEQLRNILGSGEGEGDAQVA